MVDGSHSSLNAFGFCSNFVFYPSVLDEGLVLQVQSLKKYSKGYPGLPLMVEKREPDPGH